MKKVNQISFAFLFLSIGFITALKAQNTGILDCVAPTDLYCGSSAQYSNNGFEHVYNYATCPWNEPGMERVFKFVVYETAQFTFDLINFDNNTDLDVFLLTSCDPGSCIAYGDNTINAQLTPGDYFIVIDTYSGGAANFFLTVSCSDYCQGTGYNYSQLYLNSLSVGEVSSVTGNNGGYYLNPGLAGQLQRGNNINWALLEGGSVFGTFPQYWFIYIDLNVDHDFNDVGEQVFFQSTSGSTPFAGGYINIPNTVPHTITRMRVIASQNYIIDPCAVVVGEVEDYTVEIIPFCPAQGNTVDEYIDQITVGTLHQETGNNYGYTDFTTDTYYRQMQKGQYIPISLTAGFTDYYNQWYENFRMWIDYSGNGNFENNEQVFEGLAQGSQEVEGGISIPENATSGATGMRISMRNGDLPEGCPSGSYLGETEDYMINIVPYCPSEMTSGDGDGIFWVHVGTLANGSGLDGGYKDFTNLAPPDITAGLSAAFQLRSVDPVPYFWGIWLDKNLDESFTTDEQVYNAYALNPDGVFNVPINFIQNTILPMRVTMRKDYAPVGCLTAASTDYSYDRLGETEDYKVRIVIPCAPPDTGYAFLQSPTSALVLWYKNYFATKYQLRYRQSGTSAWTTLNVSASYNHKILTNLIANTTYEFMVRTVCNGAYTPWSALWNFSTTPVATCETPSNNLPVPNTPTTETVYWEYIGAATSYQIRYRTFLPGSAWITKSSSLASIKLKSLSPGTTYAYQIRARCGNVYSDWTPEYIFTTMAAGLSPEIVNNADNSEPVAAVALQPILFPNPAVESIKIDMNGLQAKVATMLNIDGRILRSLTSGMLENEIDISSLPSGTYIVQIITEEGEVVVLKFVRIEP